MAFETQPPPEQTVFEIDRETIRLRHRNTLVGLISAIALAAILQRLKASATDPYHSLLIGVILLTLALLAGVHLVGYLRYVLRSRKHRVEVGDDEIAFITGDERSVLMLQDVVLIERQNRLGELISLTLRLRNQRIVRLEGYERQEQLMDIVSKRFEHFQERGRSSKS